MIRYMDGNLLEAPAEALVNAVNEVGIMVYIPATKRDNNRRAQVEAING